MPHEKCSQNCTSVHVRKTPLSLLEVQAADNKQLQNTFEVKVREPQPSWHAIFPAEFIPPANYMQKLAIKPNVVRISLHEFGPFAGKVRSVKLCMQCEEKACALNPGCEKKAQVKAHLYNMRDLRIGRDE
jgi:hypothetical protein